MTRKVLLALAALWSLPAAAQIYNNTLPVTCISAGNCIAATPVSNPDGTAIGAGGGGSVPTGTAGTPNASVVTVQGITGGTPQPVSGTVAVSNFPATQPISAASLPLPTGAATATNQATMAANQTATGASAQTVQGADAAGTTAAARPFGMGVLSGTATIERARDANSASATTGAGLLGAGVLGKYVATAPTFTDGQWGGLNIDTRGNLRTVLFGANSNAAVDAGTLAADGLSNFNGLKVISGGTVFNGTTSDRQRDATSTNGTTGTGLVGVGNLGWDGAAYRRMLTDTAGNGFVISKGGATLATGQVSVGTTATLVAAARTGRQKIGVTVTTAVQCAFGNTGVTLTTGWPLAAVAYASDSWDTAAALYAVCASTATVGYREQY